MRPFAETGQGQNFAFHPEAEAAQGFHELCYRSKGTP